MTSNQYFRSLQWVFRLGAFFMFCEAIYHASGIRIAGTDAFWPESAIELTRFYMLLWASASFMVAVVLFYMQKNIEHSKQLLVLLTIPALVHAGVLLMLSLTPFKQVMPLSNMYFWVPFYGSVIRGEAAILLVYVAYIAYGKQKRFL